MTSLPILPIFIFLGTGRFFPKSFTVVIVPPIAALIFSMVRFEQNLWLGLNKIYESVTETLFSIFISVNITTYYVLIVEFTDKSSFSVKQGQPGRRGSPGELGPPGPTVRFTNAALSRERPLFIHIRVLHSDASSTAINWGPDKN